MVRDMSGEMDREYKIRCRCLIGCNRGQTVVKGARGIDNDGDRAEDNVGMDCWGVEVDYNAKAKVLRCHLEPGVWQCSVDSTRSWRDKDRVCTDRRKNYPELTRDVFVKEASRRPCNRSMIKWRNKIPEPLRVTQ
jgi:hypothetical protein